mmetsp:Transcript_31608/g.56732  ORF Transcript_31608/g.56732 Transcript_31608/m.56732 type:complete len:113 (-) Transcript_31608:77-415(-)
MGTSCHHPSRNLSRTAALPSSPLCLWSPPITAEPIGQLPALRPPSCKCPHTAKPHPGPVCLGAARFHYQHILSLSLISLVIEDTAGATFASLILWVEPWMLRCNIHTCTHTT